MTVAPYPAMARNNAYANATLHKAVSGLSAEGFAARRVGFFPSLKATLNHIHKVDLFYLDALERAGQGRAMFDAPEIDRPAPLAAAQGAADARLIAFCDGLDPGLLQQTRHIPFSTGGARERVLDILLHLFQHQIHHRGQAHSMVLEAGLMPPPLDEFHLASDSAPLAKATRARFGN